MSARLRSEPWFGVKEAEPLPPLPGPEVRVCWRSYLREEGERYSGYDEIWPAHRGLTVKYRED